MSISLLLREPDPDAIMLRLMLSTEDDCAAAEAMTPEDDDCPVPKCRAIIMSVESTELVSMVSWNSVPFSAAFSRDNSSDG